MSVIQDFIDAILGDTNISPTEYSALFLPNELGDYDGTDPIMAIVHRHGISEREAFCRAARFCGITFFDRIPREALRDVAPIKLNALAHTQSVRGQVLDKCVVFVSPKTRQFLQLRQQVFDNPDAVRLTCIVPPSALRQAVYQRHTNALVLYARQRLVRKWPHANAHLDLTRLYRLGFLTCFAAILGAATFGVLTLNLWVLPLLVPLFLIPAWFRLSAIFSYAGAKPVVEPPADALLDVELPTYTILLPLRDEAHMVPQLAKAMRELDYPPEKLDIKFVVEALSPKTVAAVQKELEDGANGEMGQSQFELIIVPNAAPHTKPKALNFALPMARGEHLVVYDAEDLPDRDQLRRAAALFESDPRIACIQAELVVDNADHNWITALFAAEYGALFGILMPNLVDWGLPMPLGGTSNHFQTQVLQEIGGWDAFNVTEDADIGIRLSRLRFKSATLPSRTYEEMPAKIYPWMRQRTRWMKGWMQTLMVHNRHPIQTARQMGLIKFLAFEIYVGSFIIGPPLLLLFLGALVTRLILFGTHLSPPDDNLALVQFTLLLSGHLSAVALSIAGMLRLKLGRLMKYQLLLPLYWIVLSIAGMRAAWELMWRPFYWAKTHHTQAGSASSKLGTNRGGRVVGRTSKARQVKNFTQR